MTFICATKLKHISTDQIKTAFRFSLNATWSNAPTASIKERYVTSSGAMLKQRQNKTISFHIYNKMYRQSWSATQLKLFPKAGVSHRSYTLPIPLVVSVVLDNRLVNWWSQSSYICQGTRLACNRTVTTPLSYIDPRAAPILFDSLALGNMQVLSTSHGLHIHQLLQSLAKTSPTYMGQSLSWINCWHSSSLNGKFHSEYWRLQRQSQTQHK